MNFTVTLLSLSLAGSALALLLFVAKPLLKNRVSKAFLYYIWLLVLLRLMAPVTLSGGLMERAFSALPAAAPAVSAPADAGGEGPGASPTHAEAEGAEVPPAGPFQSSNLRETIEPLESPVPAPEAQSAGVDWERAAGFTPYLWAAGALLFLAVTVGGYLRLLSQLRIHRRAAEPALAAEAAQSGGRRVRLFYSPLCPTPMLVGLFRPAIYLPDRVYTPLQLSHILRHELTHLRRGDLFLKWCAVLVGAVHWFNPVVHLVRREFSRACELSCDEAAVRPLDRAARREYGETLLAVAAESRPMACALSTTMCEEKRTMKDRILTVTAKPRSKVRSRCLSITLVALLLYAALLLGACTPQGGGSTEKNFSDYLWETVTVTQAEDSFDAAAALDAYTAYLEEYAAKHAEFNLFQFTKIELTDTGANSSMLTLYYRTAEGQPSTYALLRNTAGEITWAPASAPGGGALTPGTLLTYLKERTTITPSPASFDVDAAFEGYAAYLERYQTEHENFSHLLYTSFTLTGDADGGSSLLMYYADGEGLTALDQLAMNAAGEVSWGPSGPLRTPAGYQVFADDEVGYTLIARGERIPCPLGLDFCDVDYWALTLYYRDSHTGEEIALTRPQTAITATAMTTYQFVQQDADGVVLAIHPIVPHSDENVTVTCKLDPATRTLHEQSRVGGEGIAVLPA